ncbi:MAG: hypothetical protein CMB37_01525 [Euryarchaeota archaeon]|nr:hypothetical protein [Euryarchaeota archaeon]
MTLPEPEEYESVFSLEGITDQEPVSKNNWIGPDGTESGPDVPEDWYLKYDGPAPIVEDIYDETYVVDRGNGAVPVDFYIKKWGAPEGFGKTDYELENRGDGRAAEQLGRPQQLHGAALIFIWFFTIVWCGGSLIATVFMGGALVADLGTSEWTPVDGVVTDSGVSTEVSTDSEGGSSTTYCLWVEYEYVFENRSYDGDMVSYSKDSGCSSSDSNADQDYPPGENITVYVNPENPDEAVLLSGWAGVDWFMLVFIVFPLAGIFLLWVSIRASINWFKYWSSSVDKSWTVVIPIVLFLVIGNGIASVLIETGESYASWYNEDEGPTFVLFGEDFTLEDENETGLGFSGNLSIYCPDFYWYAVEDGLNCTEVFGSEFLNISVSCSVTNLSNNQRDFCSDELFERILIAFTSNESGLIINYEDRGFSEYYWEVYDGGNAYCEWDTESWPDINGAWSCKVDASDESWDTWWLYCEHHSPVYYCTDMFWEVDQGGNPLNESRWENTSNYAEHGIRLFGDVGESSDYTADETRWGQAIMALTNFIGVPILFGMIGMLMRQH